MITEESKRKRSKTLKGRTFSKESLKKMSECALKRFSDKRNHPRYGKKFPEEVSDKIRKALKGRTLSELHNPEKASKIRKKIKKARAKQIFPVRDSSIEIKIQNYLKELGIEFYTHKQVNVNHSYQCDILIPSLQMIIECDGDYFHGNPEVYKSWKELTPKQKIQKIKDYLRTAELESKGYTVLRIWEKEIKSLPLNTFNTLIREA